jgi:hypothetical protein
MKRIRIVSALLALAVLAALAIVATTSKHSVRAVYASTGCTDATLKGSYAFFNTGFATPDRSVQGQEDPFAAVGVSTFDGLGNFSVNATVSFLGVVKTNQSTTGTYTVNSDCTGSISLTAGDDAGFTFNLVIIGGGTEVVGIEGPSGITGTLDAKRQ